MEVLVNKGYEDDLIPESKFCKSSDSEVTATRNCLDK
jgi:hypothetical protein